MEGIGGVAIEDRGGRGKGSLSRSLSLSARQDASKHLFFVSETVPLSDSGQIELAQAGGERPFLVRSRPAGKSLNFFLPFARTTLT